MVSFFLSAEIPIAQLPLLQQRALHQTLLRPSPLHPDSDISQPNPTPVLLSGFLKMKMDKVEQHILSKRITKCQTGLQ